jgi:hypothetical protein
MEKEIMINCGNSIASIVLNIYYVWKTLEFKRIWKLILMFLIVIYLKKKFSAIYALSFIKGGCDFEKW